jgi:hypothetical protein
MTVQLNSLDENANGVLLKGIKVLDLRFSQQ